MAEELTFFDQELDYSDEVLAMWSELGSILWSILFCMALVKEGCHHGGLTSSIFLLLAPRSLSNASKIAVRNHPVKRFASIGKEP